MQLPAVKSRQASQSVRGTASQTAFCAVSFRDATSYVRQARSALATVHRRRYHVIILPQPLPFLPAPMAIELPRDIWIVDEGFGLPDAAEARKRRLFGLACWIPSVLQYAG